MPNKQLPPSKPTRKKHWWLLALIPVVAIVVVAGRRLSMAGFGVDIGNPPKFIQSDFLDLSQVYSISKFRSAEGHDFSGDGETCRSMKHYFTPQFTAAELEAQKANNNQPLPPDGKTDRAIYSPVDGRVIRIDTERSGHGAQVYIVPDSAPAFRVRLFHIYVDPGISGGSFGFLDLGGTPVKAGQKIGVIAKGQGTDIAIEVGDGTHKFVSYFAVMPDSVFKAYQARGAKTRDDFIISKAYRDAHPVPCNQDDKSDQQFYYPAGYDHSQDDVHLSGYQQPDYGQMQTGPAQNYGNNVPTGR